MAKQLQALQQQTAAAVAAATRTGSSGVSSSSAGQQFSVIQNPALSAMAAGKQVTLIILTNSKYSNWEYLYMHSFLTIGIKQISKFGV